ncbi:MAG: hypothetical protein K9G72_19110 [Rhodobacteraceae bacterium]|nr:hypothetical protein [Paracoccaceae bacterium]MCF8520188.1 hypothetical protein [Paracoccaceae bacterium]
MAEDAAATRGNQEDQGAAAPCGNDKHCGRDGDLPRPHPALIEIVRLLARAQARSLRD